MTQKLALQIFQRLQVYYPKSYQNFTQEQIKIFVDDFVRTFEPYKDDDVLLVLKEWHNTNSFAPTVADILNQLKFKPEARLVPFKEKKYEIYIGADGNEYAREIK